MHYVGLVRYPVFATLAIFSLIVLGLDGHLISEFGGDHDGWGVGVATAVLTLVSIIPVTIIDVLRQGAISSFVAVELGWFFFLWVMWIATFGATAGNTLCNNSAANGINVCSQIRAVEAFSFLAWFVLFAYWVLLLVFSLRAFSKGDTKIWVTSTRDADFNGASGGIPVYNTSYPTQQPTMAQHQQPIQYPPTGGPV